MDDPNSSSFILPRLVELRKREEPQNAYKSSAFNVMRSRLIQAQYQSDQEQQYRVSHEDAALGTLARLPLEVRCQIYRLCFPPECTETDQILSKSRSNLMSLMRTTRCIYNEIKPLLDRHAQTRLFNLVLSDDCVHFESKQRFVGFLTQQELQGMKSETFLPLGVFARTLPRIRSLRLAIELDPAVPPAGLVAALQPFAMWVFSLIARAEALRVLKVDFHVNFTMDAATRSKFDSSNMGLVELIGTLLGTRAATHCQSILQQALTSELHIVRFVVHQKSSQPGAPEEKIKSWRWNRPAHLSRSPEAVDKRNEFLMRNSPLPAIYLSDFKTSQEYSSPPPKVGPREPSDIVFDRNESIQSVDTRGSPRYSALPPATEFSDLPSSPEYSPPSPEVGVKQLPYDNAISIDSIEQRTPSQHSCPAHSPPFDSIEPRNSLNHSLPPPQLRKTEPIKWSEDPIKSIEPRASPKSSLSPAAITILERSIRKTSQGAGEVPFWVDSASEPEDNEPDKASTETTTPTVTSPLNGPASSPEPLGHDTKLERIDAAIAIASPTRRKPSLRATLKELRVASKEIQTPSKMRVKKEKRKDNEGRYVVKRLLEDKVENGITYMKVRWQGYQEMTWEPRAQLDEDVPHMVVDFDRRRQKKIEAAEEETRWQGSGARQMTREHGRVPLNNDRQILTTPAKAKATTGTVSSSRNTTPTPTLTKLNAKAETSSASWKPTQTPASIYTRYPPAPTPQNIKKPLTAMALYTQANRSAIATDLCGQLGHPELVEETKVLTEGARRWLVLDIDQKVIWQRLHTKRVAAYHVQMEAWRKGLGFMSLEEARGVVEQRRGEVRVVDLT